jgi:ribosomal protein S4
MRKPFHLKTKLLDQTKINLWGKDIDLLKKKLKRQKWGFLNRGSRGRFSQQSNKRRLDLFRYSPFSAGFAKRRLNMAFKNNLYLRKLTRLKYGRLKNKEFSNLFNKNKSSYKTLISSLGSRLDISLFNLLVIDSIFYLRQTILHGKVLINGSKACSPNIDLKPFDVISLKLSDFSQRNCLYSNIKDQSTYLGYMGFTLFKYSNFNSLSKESQQSFIKKISLLLAPNHKGIVERFFIEYFNTLVVEKVSRTNQKKLNIVLIEDLIKILNSTYIKQKFLGGLKEYKNFAALSGLASSCENNKSLGFFNNSLIYDNFEFIVTGDYLDIVFLGFSENNIKLKGNDKYSLHYLYV